MSKLICDVCGTSYPETATQCPICGCVRPGDVLTVMGDTNDSNDSASKSYTYVKGGRFSKSNVKKRNRGQVMPNGKDSSDKPDKEGGVDRILAIVVIILLLAIISVAAYIVLQLYGPSWGLGGADKTESSTNSIATTLGETTESTASEILCKEIILSKTTITFEKAGAAVLLNVTTDPSNTTEQILFSSSDESVATVTNNGKVTSVAPGEAVITATCGDATAQCKVACTFEGDAQQTKPTETTTVDESFKLNREDFTLFYKGEKHDLYDGSIPDNQIQWSSGNEQVATVKNGIVTAVGTGNTYIYAQYNGTKLQCRVICGPNVGPYTGPAEGTQTSNSGTNSGKFTMSDDDGDATIAVGESFVLTVKDASGKVMNVTWTVADTSVCSVDGNSIKGLAAGKTTVTCTYEGDTFSCIIRVKGA